MAEEKVLVAEDDPTTCRFIASLLDSKGYRVVTAGDGRDAYELALRQHPDLIICDVIMPYRDGFEVLRAVRRDERLARIPVVILSMRDREEDIVRGLEMGADDYVVKPFNARELVARVRKRIEGSRRELGTAT